MTEQEAEAIMDADYSGELELDEGYSGRGMYGRTTWAIICPDFRTFDEASIEAVGKSSSMFRTDNMGLQYVVY